MSISIFQPKKRPIKTALHQAVLDGRIHQVRLLVSKHHANVDCRDLNGRTPLMLSCMLDNEERGLKMTTLLLKEGAYLNTRDHYGRTALTYACMASREAIIEYIIHEDALDINEPDNDGNTPLHHAAISGNPRIVELIVDAFKKFSLDIDTRNKLGYTALLLACKNGNFASGHILMTHGNASPTLRDNECYMDASNWTKRCHAVRMIVQRRAITAPAVTATPLSFSRENTLYQRAHTPICKHVKLPPDPFSQTLDAVLHLPTIMYRSAFKPSESEIDGQDARKLLIDDIRNTVSDQRPMSTATARLFHPSTAKLIRLSRRERDVTASVPDLPMMLRMYSDQYYIPKRQPRSRKHESKLIVLS